MNFDSKLNLSLNKGEVRLRVVISAIAFIGAYIFFVANWNNDNILIYLLIYPILSILLADVAYILVTVVYWILDGFTKAPQEPKIKQKINSKILLKIASGASDNIVKELIEITGITLDKSLEKTYETNKMLVNGWQNPSLVHTYALTCICMMLREPTFMKSEVWIKFHDAVVKELVSNSENEREKYFGHLEPKIKENFKYSTEQLTLTIDGIHFFIKSMHSKKDPLRYFTALNEMLAKIIGLSEETHLSDINDATSKTFLMIENSLKMADKYIELNYS